MSIVPPALEEFKGVWEYLDKLSQTDPEAYSKFVAEQKAQIQQEPAKNPDSFQAEPKLTLVAKLDGSYILPNTDKSTPTVQKCREDVEIHVMIVHICQHDAVGPAQLKRGPPGKAAPSTAHISNLLIPLSVGPVLPAKRAVQSEVEVESTAIKGGTRAGGAQIKVTEDLNKSDFKTIRKARQSEDPETAYITDDADEDEDNLADADTVRSFIQKAVRGARAKFRRENKGKRKTTGSGIEIISANDDNAQEAERLAHVSVRVRIWCCEAVFHPTIIERVQKDAESRLAVIDLGLQHIEEDHSVSFERPYSILDRIPKIGTKLVHYTKESQETKATSNRIFNDLMGKLQTQSEDESGSFKSKNKSEIVITANKVDESELLKEGLKLPSGAKLTSKNNESTIERLGQTSDSQDSTELRLAEEVKAKPSFLVSVKEGKVSVVIDISKEAAGVQSIEVDISDTHWTISSPMYYCMVPFPRPVFSDGGCAKFNKKKGTLTITAQFL